MAYYPGVTSAHVTKALQYMVAQVGDPYIWGGTGPNGFDCSGLAVAGFRAAGINMPRFTTYSLMRMGVGVSRSQLAPGDAILPNAGHVFWYIGNGKVVEAARRGVPVRVRSFSANEKVYAIRRLGPPGNAINVSGDVVGGAPIGIPNPFTAPIDALLKGFEPIAGAIESLTSRDFWVRVGMFLSGIMMILIGLNVVAGKQVVSAVKGLVPA